MFQGFIYLRLYHLESKNVQLFLLVLTLYSNILDVSFDHYMMHQPDGKWECMLCKKSFSRKYVLKRHISNLHQENQEAICPICHKRYKNPHVLEGHMSKIHRDVETKSFLQEY